MFTMGVTLLSPQPRPALPMPPVGQTVLLIHGNGNLLANTFIDDATGKAVTGGNVTTTASSKFNGSSILFNSANYLSVPDSNDWKFLAGDFTIDCWVSASTIPGTTSYAGLMAQRDSGGNQSWSLYLNGDSGTIRGEGNDGSLGVSGPGNVTLNRWCHVLLTRKGPIMKCAINGQFGPELVIGNTPLKNMTQVLSIGILSTSAGYLLNGYMCEIRVVKGVSLTLSDFTPPEVQMRSLDPFYDNVSLLINGDGTEGATTFTDLSKNKLIVNRAGSAQIQASIKKFGSGSINLPGSGSNLFIGSAVASITGDFTIECWVYLNAASTAMAIAQKSNGGNSGWRFAVNASQQLVFAAIGPSNESGNICTGATTIPVNTWTHVAAIKASTALRIFVNGNQDGALILAAAVNDNSDGIYIGRDPVGIYADYNGNIDDLRITPGIARYGSLGLPTPIFPHWTSPVGDAYFNNVALLLHGYGAIDSQAMVDSSNRARTVTANGTVRLSSTVTQFSSPITYSIAFSGTGDYLTVPDSSDFTCLNDFSVEGWFYPNQLSTTQCLMRKGSGAFTDGWVINVPGGGTGTLQFAVVGPSNDAGNILTSSTFPFVFSVSTWNHFAVSKVGSVLNVYVNGHLMANLTLAAAIADNTSPLYIGRDPNDTSRDFSGYMQDIRITTGVSRLPSISFNPPTTPYPDMSYGDPLWRYVVAQLNFDDGATNDHKFTDDTGLTVWNWNSAGGSVLNNTSRATGLGSLTVNGAGGYIYTTNGTRRYLLGTGDFTIECFFKRAVATTQGQVLIDFFSSGGTGRNWKLWLNESLNPEFMVGGSSVTAVLNWPAVITDGSWHHLAVSRCGGVFRLFCDGSQVASTTGANSYDFSNDRGQLTIGAQGNAVGSYDFNGNIDAVRITKGAARYSGAYVMPTAPFIDNLGLTGARITPVASAPAASIFANLTSFWEFEQNSGLTTFLDSHKANHLQLNVGQTSTQSGTGVVGRGMVLNRTNGMTAYIPRSNTALDLPNSDFTFGGWMTFGNSGAGGEVTFLMGRIGDGSSSSLQAYLSYDGTNLNGYASTDGTSAGRVAVSLAADASTLYHVALTLNKTGSQLELRLRTPSGSLQKATAAFTGNLFTGSTNANFNISGGLAGDSSFFPGTNRSGVFTADQCFYMLHAITDAEFNSLWNNGVGQSYKAIKAAAGF